MRQKRLKRKVMWIELNWIELWFLYSITWYAGCNTSDLVDVCVFFVFCFVLFCFVLFCFVLFCFVSFLVETVNQFTSLSSSISSVSFVSNSDLHFYSIVQPFNQPSNTTKWTMNNAFTIMRRSNNYSHIHIHKPTPHMKPRSHTTQAPSLWTYVWCVGRSNKYDVVTESADLDIVIVDIAEEEINCCERVCRH